ncbi:hypothetical protein F0562_006897 [Nyssa sinensis]|uniref:RRM domain-containing protein n=1 Tax=Nyssa sinensis TaxID=561372 RepID=A0A5J5ASD9_9ASTE|nr:hypothetical protein F0562_006897 [Nyssa sinensis]
MRTRNAETPKSAAVKKTPPAKKSAVKTPPNPPELGTESATPKTTVTKRASATRTKQVKVKEAAPNTDTDSKLEPAVEEVKASTDAVQVTPETKVVSGTKTTKTVVKRIPARTKTPTSAKAVSRQTPKLGETGKAKVEESTKKEEVGVVKDVESAKKEESTIAYVEESTKKEEPAVENVEESTQEEDCNVNNIEEPLKEKEKGIIEAEKVHPSPKQDNPPVVAKAENSSENQEPSVAKEEEEMKEEIKELSKNIEYKVEAKNGPVNMQEDNNGDLKGEATKPEEDECHGEERMEEYGIQEVLEEFGEEELVEDDVHDEEAEALEEEQMELTAVAKERKIKKELEIFVGGLDRDAVEEDVKKAFEKIGDVVDVRLHKNPLTNKNKGYAFVKFATKEQASRALAEMKNPIIRGKRCGTASSEDNDTLFLGNICNTWTREAIKQKLKEYGIEGVENITLVPDAQHEGLSRGFAFIEFSCHADAMLAYKRLQKPDVIFGHPERTAKVAFAEPLREPDPEVMAQVKSVFVDGLPPHWDEDHVREQFKIYGEIERIMLARNMSTAKRKDFGFVDFTTHEAAVASIAGINNIELGDANSKTKVKARLSNPLPKIQAVKGGMCGGFRIGHGGAGSSSTFGRAFGRGGYPFNRANFQRGRGFYQRGRGQAGRLGFFNDSHVGSQYPPFHGRQMFGRGGRRGSFGGTHLVSGGVAAPARPNLERPRHGATDRGHGRPFPARRQPFFPEEGLNRTFAGRQFDDPYFYDDSAHGIKRPFFMTEPDPDYMEPSRLRPRFDYSDPAVPFQGSRYQDTFQAEGGLYSHDYYGSDYGGSAYSSFYQGDHPYGGGHYY